MKKIYSLIALFSMFALQGMSQGLVINEIDYDQPSVDSAEFIELYNAGSSAVNLGDYTVTLLNGNNNTLYDSLALPQQSLNPGDYFVICSPYGKTPNCDMVKSNPLPTGWIQNGSPDAVGIRENSSGNLIDVVSYEGNCLAPYVSGNGLPLANSDTAQSDSIANRYLSISRFPDGNDTNNDSLDWNRVCATPGYANTNTNSSCPTPTQGLVSVNAHKSVSVYPNPSRGMINLDLKAISGREVKVTVNNMIGNVVMEASAKNTNGTAQLDLSDLQNGVYIVKITAANGTFVQRVVLKK